MTDAQFGLVSSSYTLGGLMGALAAGPLSTKYGRLLVLRVLTVFFISGPVAETLASNIPLFVAGRLISGIGAGASLVVVPIYISEISPSNSRGLFGAFTQVMANVGILMTQGLGYFLSKGSMWRIILAVSGVIGVFQLVGLVFVVESPIWLADNQQLGQAKKALQRIRGPTADISQETKTWAASTPSSRSDAMVSEAEEEESLLATSQSTMPAAKVPVTMFGAISNPTYRPAIISVIAVMLTQQFTGINSIIMYSVSILSTILPTTAALLTVLVSCLNLIMTIVCAPLSDKLGRKTCILLSIAGMGSMSMLLAIGMASSLKILSAVATLLFVGSFAFGLGPVPFILASELVGPEAVGATQSWALATSWIATFIIAQFFPALNDYMGAKGEIYWLFTAMAVILGSFIGWWVPETKGKSNMDEVWQRTVGADD
ncbi:sugar transport protein 8 [Arthroderma uncinatum]|uniref:sugar transport protein 8 n=1 Tax=Arthroderma uncinatum TaxID=74035 RepID=UPI00144A7C22|nr:sugar transport protein 8 [Arthroderma uncinatum]KAF3491297.1 sugar transport protein 8 [Arthroderma uncinatum]